MIWCVEDDPSIREIIVYALNTTGIEAFGFEDGQIFWDTLQERQPDLVLLDVMLPGIDGIELLTRMKGTERFRDIPVIMATAKGTEFDKVQSLDLGADDYLVKPFGMMEMLSRVKAVLRRYKPVAEKEAPMLRIDRIYLSLRERMVWVGGEKVDLTYKEFEMLHLFMSNPGEVFTREQLYEKVWGKNDAMQTRTVDIHIQTLRKKLGVCGCLIECERMVGYRIRKMP